MDDHFLDDCWTLYFHDPDDSEWTKNSYKIIHNVSTVEDWAMMDSAFSSMWTKGMFFLMREHIQPLWEDQYNRNGGCFSFKVNKPEASEYLFNICSLMIGNMLVNESKCTDEQDVQSNICGISLSPKRNYCIVRLWIGNNAYNNVALYNIETPSYTQVLYKSHEENEDFVVPSNQSASSASSASSTPNQNMNPSVFVRT